MPIYTHKDDPIEAGRSFARLVSTLMADGIEFRTLGGMRLLVDDATHAALTGEGAPAPRKAPAKKSAAKPKPKAEKPQEIDEDAVVVDDVELPGFEGTTES